MNLTVEKYGEIYPAIWEICERCRGVGSHANPVFDGFSSSDFSYDNPFMDPDFCDDYRSGVYDVVCYDCNGAGKILEVDFSKCSPEQEQTYLNDHHDVMEMYAIQRAEMRLGY